MKGLLVLFFQAFLNILVIFAHSDHKIGTPFSFLLVVLIGVATYFALKWVDK